MTLSVRPIEGKKDLETFLHVPWKLGMKDDPLWVPPLLDDYRRLLNPKKSPFLKHGELQCFLAEEDGKPVGRICAQIDTDFDKQWPAEVGVAFFGFFDSKDDATDPTKALQVVGLKANSIALPCLVPTFGSLPSGGGGTLIAARSSSAGKPPAADHPISSAAGVQF